MGFLWLKLLQSKQTCTEPGTHYDPLQGGHVSMEKMLIACPHLFPQRRYVCPNSQGNLLCQGQQIDPSDVRRLKNLYIMAAATLWSSHVFSWVEEAADVGKQGCNPKHGDADDVSVGTHVAKGTLTAASRLHLHGRCPQRLLQRGASCSRTGSGAHKAKHRRAGKGQEHASEHTWGGASHVASFATQRAAQERPSKRSSWNKLKPKSSRSPMWIQTR